MPNETLSSEIAKFLQSQTSNPKIVKLGAEIQNQMEQGHTAIEYQEILNDTLISSDGQSGYIVQKNGLSGFRRFYNQEQSIKADFLNSVEHNLDKKIDNKVLKSAIETVVKLLNLELTDSLDLQWQACIASLHKARYILTGGPGTGKTTTVIRMMLLYLTLNNSKNIALSAPTGKAANQMMHSISQQLANLDLPIQMRQRLNIKAQTLHRLLGYNNQSNTVKYNQHNPLPYDLIIIDESSMLDVSLTHALLQALKPQAQLLLLGDKNQLPAVEAGNVFADLCYLLQQKDNHKSSHNLLKHFLTQQTEVSEIENHTELSKNYRFADASLIAQLCSALSNKKLTIFHQLRESKKLDWTCPNNKTEKKQSLENWYKSIPKDQTAILLSPVNNGPNSVAELNDITREILYNNNLIHQNMPIMMTQNDYALGVFNGDIGHLTLIDNQWHASLTIEGKQKSILLNALSFWQQANAISIHKSQGSEYDHVLIAIPNDEDLNILTNALLYTAISRAKLSITLWASDQIIGKIIKTSEKRLTFLNN